MPTLARWTDESLSNVIYFVQKWMYVCVCVLPYEESCSFARAFEMTTWRNKSRTKTKEGEKWIKQKFSFVKLVFAVWRVFAWKWMKSVLFPSKPPPPPPLSFFTCSSSKVCERRGFNRNKKNQAERQWELLVRVKLLLIQPNNIISLLLLLLYVCASSRLLSGLILTFYLPACISAVTLHPLPISPSSLHDTTSSRICPKNINSSFYSSSEEMLFSVSN